MRTGENRPWFCHTGNKCWVPHSPDFLRRLAALRHFMRLSLMKGADADLSSAAWQEIGVKPSFGLSGIMALDVPPLKFSHGLHSPSNSPTSTARLKSCPDTKHELFRSL